MKMDEHMRSRLRALAQAAESEPLDEPARARVAANVERRGPKLIAIQRRVRAVLVVGSIAAAAALALVWSAGSPGAVLDALPSQEMSASAGVPAGTCGVLPAPDPATPSTQPLGPDASVHASADASWRWISRDACTPIVELTRGEVDVDLATYDGEIRVRHGAGVVVAHAARFTVVASDQRLEVVVTFGSVTLDLPSGLELLASGESRVLSLDGTSPAASRSQSGLLEAEQAWRSGARQRATAIFERVGRADGQDAEAAWIRLARLRVEAGDLDGAARAIEDHDRRFPTGSLGPEAGYLRVEVAIGAGDSVAARAAAEQLSTRFPRSAQAPAARRRVEALTD